MKHRHERRHRRGDHEPAIDWRERLNLCVLGTAVALIVIGTLIPSESSVLEGSYAPLAAVWCLLLVMWAFGQWMSPQPAVIFGWTEIVGLLLVGWNWVAGLVALSAGNGRSALNVVWLVVSYGIAVFLLRQTLRTTAQVRALFAAMIWLATLLACFGFYQYFYSFPAQRAAYKANPEEFLRDGGQESEPGSPERKRFEDRLESKEPFATFALTNSLAGLLAPWLIATLAIALTALGTGQRRLLLTAAIVAVILAGCLVLTKSRTAYLAVAAGVVLLAMYGRDRGWRLDWRIPAAGAAVIVVLALSAVYFGGLDTQVLSEAPKSVLYRLEYWQATAAMIAEHPVFGCGPGNFKENYTAYKLPQASEAISDPHNFLLEIWATAGTPAIVLLLLLGVAFAVDLARTARQADVPHSPQDSDGGVASWTMLGGALAGLIAAAPLGVVVLLPLVDVAPSIRWFPVVWLLGFPLLGAVWWALAPWIAGGRVSLAAAIVPQVVLLVNLLAAGAVVFPGVVATLLVLIPAALFLVRSSANAPKVEEPAARMPREWPLSRRTAILLTLAAVWSLAMCVWTEYWPVLVGRMELSGAEEARARGRLIEAEGLALRAAVSDGFSPEPWRLLTYVRLEKWIASGDELDWQAFVAAADGLQQRDPQHQLTYRTRGSWFLTAWRKSQRPEHLELALPEFRRASERYPNSAFNRAQLAWVLHLAGRDDEARTEAEIAHKLDGQTPHADQKLARQKIVDPQIAADGRILLNGPQSAEQIVEQLRKSAGTKQGTTP